MPISKQHALLCLLVTASTLGACHREATAARTRADSSAALVARDAPSPDEIVTAKPDAELPLASADAAIASPPLTPTSKPRSRDETLTAAMVEFVQALRAQDVEKLVALFPRERPLKIVSSIAGNESIPYSRAAAEMRSRSRNEGLYSLLVDAPDPTFAEFVLDGVEWTWAGGTRFVPEGEGKRSNVYVTWRKEKGRWVIDTIGYPVA